jgi:hypothetical protein
MQAMQPLQVTFRTHPLATIIWFAATTLIAIAFYFVFYVTLNVPILPLAILSLLIFGSYASGVLMTRAFLTMTLNGFTHRFLFTRTYTWTELTHWTQWGEGNSIFIRTRSGHVITFSHWLVYGGRYKTVYEILAENLGPESKGANAVFPDIAKTIFGTLVLTPPQDDPEQCDAPKPPPVRS